MGAIDNPAAGCDCCNDTAGATRCGGGLPDSPDCAVNYHFGQLLGVEDFRADQGFHIGHQRRHQRLLHGWGVVWGLAVSFVAETRELRVAPGHALDRQGRDLVVAAAQCMSLPAWWAKHRDDEIFAGIPNKDDATFDADVIACYRSCLTRPVPALADPCTASGSAGQAGSDMAYSRICETVQLYLVPRMDPAPAAQPGPGPYHLLRLLLGLDEVAVDADGDPLPDDAWLAGRLADIAALPAADAAAATADLWQAVIARAAAATTDTRLAAVWSPPDQLPDGSGTASGDCLVLARLSDIHVFPGETGPSATVGGIDMDRRMTLLPSQTLQAALLRPGVAAAAAPAGPVLVADGLAVAGTDLQLTFNRPLAAASVTAQAFAAAEFDAATGWSAFTPGVPAYDDASRSVTLPLDRAPTGARVRVTVRGAGPTPLLGADFVAAGAPAPDADGRDLSTTITGS